MASDQIKIVCVNIKSLDSPREIKTKILKGLRKAERKKPTPVCVSQPLQSWTKELHSLADIPASDVTQMSSNSRFMVWLLRDGSVCRLKCATSYRKDKSVLEALQRPTFQELSDAEYARQLQSEIMSGRSQGESHQVPQPVYPMDEDMDHSPDVLYIDTITTRYVRSPTYYNNLPLSTADILPSSPHIEPSPLVGPRPPTSRRSTVGVKKERMSWPDVGTLEWANLDSAVKFVSIAVLHSEILLVDSVGKLYLWGCDGVSDVSPHPLTVSLGLTEERVRLVGGGDVRATIVTESGKVATFYDPLLRDVPGKGCPALIAALSHEAKDFLRFKDDPVTSLSVSNFITVATTASGRVFWWGLCPKSPVVSRPRGQSTQDVITDGSLVKLKDGPPCGPDTVVFNSSSTGTPLIGKTVAEQSGLNSKASILIKVYRNSPAGGQSSSSSTSKILKDIESSSHFENLDIWKLSDVVFLDGSPAVLGRVVTVDQHQVIVDVSGDASTSKSSLKVFKTSELELCLTTPTSLAAHPPSDQSSTHHIAGVVQHMPLLVSSPGEPEEDAPKSVIQGYRPLAVHTTNSGPSLLLEHVTNGNAFLVYSAQASLGPFETSSFVALGLASKPVRSTIQEESLVATEGGLASRDGQSPSLVSCHNSHLLLLKDVNGQLLPLVDGLKLRPDFSSENKAGLSGAYSCVHSRSYQLDKDRIAVLVMLVPQAKELLSCVRSGDLPSVQSYLTSLKQPKSKRKLSPESPSIPSKKPRIDTGEPLTLEPISPERVGIPSDPQELFQCAEHNSNILHICCELSSSAKDEHVSGDPLVSGCGSERRLAVLEALLDAPHIRPHIITLLQSKNSVGYTPFYSAIAKQNYSGALKILDFVTSLKNPDLLRAAILTPCSNGVTPLTRLFASLSSIFDLTSSQLVVSNIPSGYRAQALLRLFQLRYPSVYKVVIGREDSEEQLSDSSGDEEGMEGGIPPSVRRSLRGHRQRPYMYSSNSSSVSLKGVVYFSDVGQLRAALVEMQDYKLSIGLARNTGFGQAQQINYLIVQLADTEEESAPPTVASTYMGSPAKTKQVQMQPSGAELFNGVKQSHPSLAYTLLTKLLPLEGVAIDQGGVNETTLSSIVHNTKCLKALAEINKGYNLTSETTGEPTPYETTCTSSSNQEAAGSSSLSSRHPIAERSGPPLMPYHDMSDYLSLSDYLTNLSGQQDLAQVIQNFTSNSTGTTPSLSIASTAEISDLNSTVVQSKSHQSTAYKTTNVKSVCSCRQKETEAVSGVDLLRPLVSNWPCLVTTILGFYPVDTPCDSCTLSSVHSLDSFTSQLLLNCSADTVNVVMDTIVDRMNEAIPLVDLKELCLLYDDMEKLKLQSFRLTERNVSLLVGRRFADSAVRVLAMNHSRASNTLTTSQQSRNPDGGRNNQPAEASTSQQTSRGSERINLQNGPSPKEFAKTLWAVLSRFSWLSVASMVQAADASIAPVRLGVAKPLGASSVASEYQQAPAWSYVRSYGRSAAPGTVLRSLSQAIHTRMALNRTPQANDSTIPAHPPTSGVMLTPTVYGGIGGEGVESDIEMSDQDEPVRPRPMNQIETFDPSTDPIQANTLPFLDLDTDQSDDEDFPPLPGSMFHFEPDAIIQSEESDEERLEDIYPYAWALDGRRIGETSSGSSHHNVMANITLGTAEAMIPLASIPSIRFGSGFLARTFARLVKDLVDIVKHISDNQSTETTLSLPPGIGKLLIQRGVDTLDKTWAWVASVLDVAEGQLLCGEHFDTERHVMSLRTGGRQRGNGRRSERTSRSFVGSTPSEYIAYLIRSHTHEDPQSLPVLDLYGYEHVVYCLDGLLYFLTHLPKKSLSALLSSDAPEPETQRDTDSLFSGAASVSFNTEEEVRRSNDQFFGKEKEVFSRPVEAFPLAKQPHLLQSYVQQEQLFGSQEESRSSDQEGGREKPVKKALPISYSRNDTNNVIGSISTSWSSEHVHQRWSAVISVFAHIFLAEGPGGERSNFLNSKAGFASRMARFRHQVAQLYSESQMSRDWSRTMSNTFSIRVRREHLLQDSIDMLRAMSRFHYSSIRVKFEGEDGSGPGVNRGFFASLANDLTNSDLSKPPINQLGRLLHQPGKLPEQLGTYAPCPFVPPLSTPQAKIATIKDHRRAAFLSIGRFIGLCLWFKYNIPLTLCRHVAKFLLGRDIAWHDLAFYNADLYEGMRRMMVDTEVDKKDNEEFIAAYGCYFEAPLTGPFFSEPVLVDLIQGGSKIPVTPQRVHEYVRLYAMFTMVGCVKDELEAMKEGLNDVVPSDLLSSLTAEDFQLLLSGGSTDISVGRLRAVIRFNHTHRGSTQFKQNFEKMFWRVVKHMSNTQRQQLLYFATGSAALPAATDVSNTDSPIAITIDVINSADLDSLPVASTCSQRMSLPLYPSYTILKKKLLQAVQCQAYGLG